MAKPDYRRVDGIPGTPISIGARSAAAMASSVIPSAAFSVLAPFFIESLQISRTEIGLLITAYQAVGSILSIRAGKFVDEKGFPRAFFWLYVASITSVVLMVLPGDYYGLLLGAVLAGNASALANPATNSLVAASLPAGRRGTAIGIKQSGIQFSYFLLGGLPLLAVVANWQVALACALIVPISGLAASIPLLRAQTQTVDGQRRAIHTRSSLPTGVWWLTVYALTMGLAQASVNAYIPLHAVEALEISPQAAGLAATVLGGVGVAARIAWARSTERHSHASGALMVLSGLAFLSALLLFFSSQVGLGAFWIAVLLAGTSLAAWNSVAMLAIISEVEMKDIGRASGVVLTAFLGGLTLGPTLFGLSVDLTGTYDLGWGAVGFVTMLAFATAFAWHRA